MPFIYDHLIDLLWLVWLVYWIWAAAATKRTRRVESWAIGLSHWTPLVVGVVLLSLPSESLLGWLSGRFLPRSILALWVGAALVATGLGFAVAARVYLGRNWSGVVTLKDDHTLIRSGPYGLVRHPIYTGVLLALLGSAVARGDWRGLLSLALIAAAFRRKIAIEERWLAEQFPKDYARYQQEVPTLIPRLFRR